jgi:hypothetical protein
MLSVNKMISPMRKILLVGIAALFMATGTAHASSSLTCAEIVTRIITDGHAPIRAPVDLYVKPRGKIRGKIEGGGILYLTDDPSVQLFKGWKLIEGMEGDLAGDTYGWVAAKYLKPIKCPPSESSQEK